MPKAVELKEPETLEAASQRLTSFDFSSPVELQAAKGEAKVPTFSINAYNGGPMVVSAFYYPVVADLEGGSVAGESIPILLGHDVDKLVGQSSKVTIGESVKIDGTITGEDEHANKVKAHAKNGFKWQASIGAGVVRREFVEAGESTTVNGRTVTGPVIIAREWVLNEVSFVPIGADRTTSATVAASGSVGSKGKKRMSKATGANPAEPKIEAGGLGGDDVIQAQRKRAADEADRISRIDEIFASATVSYGLNDKGEKIEGLKSHAIRNGLDPRDVELMVVRAERSTAPPAGQVKGGDTVDAKVIEASIAFTAGLDEKVIAASVPSSDRERVMNAASSVQYRGMGLHALMSIMCSLAGRPWHGPYKQDGFLRAALEADRDIRAAGTSTFSLSGILGNVANKRLIASYQSVASVLPKIARFTSASDFKEFKSFRMTGSGGFEEVGKNGELKSVNLTEQEYANQVKTRGATLWLTRVHMINDDLGAFMEIPRLMGRMGGQNIQKEAWGEFLSALATFFTTAKGNRITGASSALSIEGLSLANKAMVERKDSNGEFILATPKTLLVPPTLKPEADNLYKETRANETTTANKPKTAANPHAGRYEPVESPHIGTAGNATLGSDAHWFLLADPQDIAVLEIAFLNGQQTPTIEQGPMDLERLGIGYRAFLDFGIAMGDDAGGVMAVGS